MFLCGWRGSEYVVRNSNKVLDQGGCTYVPSIIGESPVQRYIASNLDRMVVTLRHPSNGGPVGTSSDDGIRRDPSRLRVVGLQRVEIVKDLSKKKTAIASYSALIHYRYIWEGLRCLSPS